MGRDVEAVIGALKITLEEARNADDETWWKIDTANRWINQLPGAWTGRWRDLKLKGDSAGEVDRKEFIGHLRATVAYLEANLKPSLAHGPGRDNADHQSKPKSRSTSILMMFHRQKRRQLPVNQSD